MVLPAKDAACEVMVCLKLAASSSNFRLRTLRPDYRNHLGIRPAPRFCACMRQLLRCIVPMKMRNLRITFFISVSVAVILEKREVSIRTGIDADFRNLLRLRGAFNVGTERNNGTSTNKERQRVNGRVHCNGLAALHTLVCPIVIPVCSGRQIDLAAGGPLLGYRGH